VDEPAIAVGRVTKAHGIRGEVAVQNRSDNPERWQPGAVVFDAAGRTLTVTTVRPHRERLLVTFQEIADRTAAEPLVGQELFVPESWLPALAAGEWWAFQIEGLAVVTEAGRELGTVVEVLDYPAHDLWRIVDADEHETLLPAVEAFVVSVDLDARRAVVRDVAGLTDDEKP
jgi:16S rRNA processing protein RimM